MSVPAKAATGRVLVNFARQCAVQSRTGEIVPCHLRRGQARPVCGDLVKWISDDHGGGLIEEIKHRRNVFCKADAQGQPRIVASNLDLVVTVIAPRPQPSAELVDRYLVATRALELEALIVANKLDRDDFEAPGFSGIVGEFTALGYAVVQVSARTGAGVDPLRRAIGNRVAILVGQSGVGKSSLINALIPDRAVRTGRLSTGTGKGAHTTTATTLYELPDGGAIIDSPGVWEYGVWKMTLDQLVNGFAEFQPYLGQCRFTDCRHVAEPDCAIRMAVEKNRIHRRRWDSYRRLVEEMA